MACSTKPEQNLKHAIQQVKKLAKQGAQVICLPELFRSQYFCQTEEHHNFALAETIPGPSSKALGKLSRELKITLVASLFEKRSAGLYHNTCIVLDEQGKISHRYRKMHIPDDPGYYEKFYFTPGDLGFRSFKTPHGDMGALVCWDQWYPEAARLTALRGAQVLFYPTAIGWIPEDSPAEHQRQQEAWQTIQRSHGIANGVYVVAVNRVGQEGDIQFWGASFVSDPFGKVIAQASQKEENLLVEIDLKEVGQTRQFWPFLRDRRIDAYADIQRRFIDEDL
ncbi:MAG: carbon-nitrogen hydrolase [Deltaproteobacteria bacterium]|nr:carbon-nitrogen hydrolase [Deltaproteobacteria bacterium]